MSLQSVPFYRRFALMRGTVLTNALSTSLINFGIASVSHVNTGIYDVTPVAGILDGALVAPLGIPAIGYELGIDAQPVGATFATANAAVKLAGDPDDGHVIRVLTFDAAGAAADADFALTVEVYQRTDELPPAGSPID